MILEYYNNVVVSRNNVGVYLQKPNWYLWKMQLTRMELQAELLISRPREAGNNKFTLAWDRKRFLFFIRFSTCYLSDKELNEDVLASVVDYDGAKFCFQKNDYLVVSRDSCKQLIFQFDPFDWTVLGFGQNFAIFIPEKKDPLPSPALDLSNLLESSKFSDVMIITTNEDGERHEFSAHWNILSSRSDVFLKMFETDMKEKTEGRIEIKEFKTYVMQQVLVYIYSGKINEVAVAIVASDILRAADYYNLDPLRHMIGQILEEKLACDNAFEYLVLGDMYKVPKLKKAAIKFIVTKIDNMTDNPGFKIISDLHMHLMKDLLVALTKNN